MLAKGEFLTTKQLPDITGLSQSFFEKGRIYGYGPKFIRISSGGRVGKILYRTKDVERWMGERECNPEALTNG